MASIHVCYRMGPRVLGAERIYNQRVLSCLRMMSGPLSIRVATEAGGLGTWLRQQVVYFVISIIYGREWSRTGQFDLISTYRLHSCHNFSSGVG